MCVSGNVSGVDVTASGEGVEIASDIGDLDVSALGFEFSDESGGGIAITLRTDAPGANVATLGDELRGTADVLGFDIAGIGLHFDVEAARDGDFKFHPELGAVGGNARKLRREGA